MARKHKNTRSARRLKKKSKKRYFDVCKLGFKSYAEYEKISLYTALQSIAEDVQRSHRAEQFRESAARWQYHLLRLRSLSKRAGRGSGKSSA